MRNLARSPLLPLLLLAGCFDSSRPPDLLPSGEVRPESCDEWLQNGGGTGELVCLELALTAWDGPFVPAPTMLPASEFLRDRDVELREPLAPASLVDVDRTDDFAVALFVLPPPFRAYATFEEPGLKRTYFLSQLVTDDWAALGRSFPVMTEDGWALTHAAAGRTEDPLTGVILGDLEAPNNAGYVVTLSTAPDDPAAGAYDILYTTGGLPDPDATATSADGVFLVFGVWPGFVTVSATSGAISFVTELRVMPDAAHVVSLRESDSW